MKVWEQKKKGKVFLIIKVQLEFQIIFQIYYKLIKILNEKNQNMRFLYKWLFDLRFIQSLRNQIVLKVF